MSLTNIGKRIVLDALSALPYTGAIAREWDSIENDERFKKIEQKIAEIWDVISKDPQLPLEGSIFKLMGLIENNELVPHFNFRKTESCMVFLKEINTRSELGQANDPTIEYDECIRIVKNNINTEGPEKELKLVVYELEKEDLIYKHADLNSPLGFHAISPKEYFFCKTDSVFQKWDPRCDAKEIVKLLINDDQDSVSIEKLDVRLEWGPRRLNSAIAFLYLNALIHHDFDLGEIMGRIDYVLLWIRLTEEAYFFLDNDK